MKVVGETRYLWRAVDHEGEPRQSPFELRDIGGRAIKVSAGDGTPPA